MTSALEREIVRKPVFTSNPERLERPFEMVVLAASAGGIEALSALLEFFPPDFPVPVAIVQHRRSNPRSVLAKILQKHCSLAVTDARDHDLIEPGHVYLAPADWHLVVRDDRSFGFSDGRRIRYLRSAADPLFESAAEAYREKLIAVVLTGGDSDGSDGVRAVKEAGGLVIIQDESTSRRFDMPRSAIGTGCVDFVLPLELIGPILSQLVKPRLWVREPRRRGTEPAAPAVSRMTLHDKPDRVYVDGTEAR